VHGKQARVKNAYLRHSSSMCLINTDMYHSSDEYLVLINI